ncbi:MAG: isoamylase early set domain-containing protein [Anaerolineales bacterium]
MLKKTFIKSRKVWKVDFKLPKEECPQGVTTKRVNLTGDFNNWKHSATPMKLHDGIYTTSLELDPGHEYQFRYLINGKVWCNDWYADAYVPNIFGEDNCVASLSVVKSPAKVK